MPFGVNLAGFSRAEMGLGESVRGLARAFESVGIPFKLLNIMEGNPARHQNLSWVSSESQEAPYGVSVLNVLPDAIQSARRHLPESFFSAGRMIGFGVWETPEIPDSWQPWIEIFDEIWVPSAFVQEAFRRKTDKPIIRIPHSIPIRDEGATRRSEFEISESKFIFLTAFDPCSIFDRKNPMGAVEAFQLAFSPSMLGVQLVIKVNNPQRASESLLRLELQIKNWPNIVILPEILSPDRQLALISSIDCFVSLHRSEGFGLLGAEAMSFAKPAILTAWSGNLEYMQTGAVYPVPFRLVELDRDFGPYKKGQIWAEPDVSRAAAIMSEVFFDRVKSSEVGKSGQAVVRRYLAPKAVGSKILERLKVITDSTREAKSQIQLHHPTQ